MELLIIMTGTLVGMGGGLMVLSGRCDKAYVESLNSIPSKQSR